MTQLTINISSKKLDFFKQLIQELDGIEIVTEKKDKKKEKFKKDLLESIEQVNLAKAGKLKLKTAQELLDEL